jgi:hypothetical protein
MIKKTLILLLCLTIANCGGFTKISGLKFKNSVNVKTNSGNAGFTEDVVKLNNGKFVGFLRPIGNCGGGVTFFGVILPIVPVKFTLNNCNDSFYIQTESQEIVNLKLKYNSNIFYDSISVKKITKDGYRKKFQFKIENFSDFKNAQDLAIIVIGDNFTQELPLTWGVMTYNNWSFP